MTEENKAKAEAAKKKMMAVAEKHMEAMAVEMADAAKELGDVMVDEASPLVKLVYGATKDQLVAIMKGLVTKLDLDGDGQ
jgi:hypothetical protein